MVYRIIIYEDFCLSFLVGYNHWATKGDQVTESEGSNYQGFVDLAEDDWGKINSGAFCRLPVQWFTGDNWDILFQEKLLPISVIESGSISFNDDETRDGTINIFNEDGECISKRKISEINIVEAGSDIEQRLSGMTLEKYRNRLEVVCFPK